MQYYLAVIKEKGLRDQDPFDAVVARAGFINVVESSSYEEIVKKASDCLAVRLSLDALFLEKTFISPFCSI